MPIATLWVKTYAFTKYNVDYDTHVVRSMQNAAASIKQLKLLENMLFMVPRFI